MTALGWTLAILGGLIVGMVLASMLLFREPIEPDEDPIERQFRDRL